MRAIVRDLPADVELWAGGRGAERHAAIIGPRAIFSRLRRIPTGTRSPRRPHRVMPLELRTWSSCACRARALIAALALVATPAAAQDTTGVGAISGVVVERGRQAG